MSQATAIEWTDASWNPVVGCAKVSLGCAHCYAETMGARLKAMAEADLAAGRDPGRKRHYLDVIDERGRWNGRAACVREALHDPLKWRKPRRIFVNSMSDLFHPDVPAEFIDQVFAVMALCPQHVFQVLTKRPARMLEVLRDRETRRWAYSTPLPNVWLGVSAERQPEADERVSLLLDCPAAVRFVSAEPLLGLLDLTPAIYAILDLDVATLDWVICGGESGPHARPMHPDWARSLRDQCLAAGVPFFFKQWGEWSPLCSRSGVRQCVAYNDGRHCEFTKEAILAEERRSGKEHARHHPLCMYRVGKQAAGRVLDGSLWNEYPAPVSPALSCSNP